MTSPEVSKEQPHSVVIMHDPDPRTTSQLRSSLSLPDDDVQVLYSGIVSTVQNAAEEVVRKPPKRSTHHWVIARLEAKRPM